jgi:hypothetical protein
MSRQPQPTDARESVADAKVRESAADKGCRENCRKLLQDQVDAAHNELVRARLLLSSSPLPASATPLADRLNVKPWALDLIMAALGSLGANGLAAGLLAYSAHFRRQKVAEIRPTNAPPAPTAQDEDGRPMARVDLFTLDQIEATPTGDRLDLGAIYAAYCSRAATADERALPRQEFESMFTKLCDAVGYRVEKIGRRTYAVGMKLIAA